MTYFVSDLHGEWGLFSKLLRILRFSEQDVMYICGDIIDKGRESVRLLQTVFSYPNMHAIIGNHEHAFLQHYRALMAASPNDFDAVLASLQQYFPYDGHLLDWETVDRLESLPYYIEAEDFICVHAGIPVRPDGLLPPLSQVPEEVLVHDRRFRRPDVVHRSPRCVFFGHTQTDCNGDRPQILAYARGADAVRSMADLYKVQLDTGTWSNGVLGCFCKENGKAYYATGS